MLLYNRADLAEKQLNYIIQELKAPKVYIAIDGPKANQVDQKNVAEVLEVAKKARKQAPRGCEVIISSSESNLGCKRGVLKAVDWFFSKEPEGIIIEDDCVPEPSFFQFCDELLVRYRDDQRVGLICGSNPMVSTPVKDSYIFSNQTIIWGWAAWRRSWRDTEAVRKIESKLLENPQLNTFLLKKTSAKHLATFSKVLDNKIDTWDYIWYFTTLLSNRLAIVPQHNAVTNIGFGDRATHTHLRTTQAELPTRPIEFPLRHPQFVTVNQNFEQGYLSQSTPLALIWSLAVAWLRDRGFFRR